jgi:hypothetical protein
MSMFVYEDELDRRKNRRAPRPRKLTSERKGGQEK